MTEFDKFWEVHGETTVDKTFAEKVWQAALRASIRIVPEPPCIPKAGDKVKFLSLCHPKSLGQIKTVNEVSLDRIVCYWIYTEDADGNTSCGILGEVEKVDE